MARHPAATGTGPVPARPSARPSNPRPLPSLAVVLPVMLALAACAPVPSVSEFTPRGNETAVMVPLTGKAAFWTAFNDRQLDALMQAGLTRNLTLREAAERITEARALVGVPRAATLNASYDSRRGTTERGTIDTSEDTALSGSWLLDFFGGPSNRAVAIAQRDIAWFAADVARLALAGEIAVTYAELRYYQAVIALTRRSVDSRGQSRSSIGAQFEAGAATRLDVLRADQRLALAQAQLPRLEVEAERAVNRLATLTAQSTQAVRGLYLRGGSQPRARWAAGDGITADTIRRRPDVQLAERELYEAAARVGLARADMLPSIRLVGNVGWPASSPRGWSFGPSLNLPIFSAGANAATLSASESRARQAYLRWQQAVLEAVEEVQSELAAYRRDGRNVGAQQRLVGISQETLDLARSSYDLGETDFLSILDSEVELLDARQSLAAAELTRAINFIRLSVATAGSVDPR